MPCYLNYRENVSREYVKKMREKKKLKAIIVNTPAEMQEFSVIRCNSERTLTRTDEVVGCGTTGYFTVYYSRKYNDFDADNHE